MNRGRHAGHANRVRIALGVIVAVALVAALGRLAGRNLALVAAASIAGVAVVAVGLRRAKHPDAIDLTPARWKGIGGLFEQALEVAPEERAAFLEAACPDPALRGDVASLLDAHARSGILDLPMNELGTPIVGLPAALPAGRVVAHYEIIDSLGAGGMGVVYRARDTRLERIVALKFLPPHLSADAEAKARFRTEAQTAAALDHPNLCTIHEIGETEGGQLFIAMPCYDGETLAKRVTRGPLSLDDAVAIAVQVARGLSKAHAHGIVHRDIKPANLVLTNESLVKVVDFGIAKLVDAGVTRSGITPGTVAYMSPEQARGEPVDGRTDLWSLGVVLYQMLTGSRPFTGADNDAVLRAIRDAEPVPPSRIRTDVPAALERITLRALAKRVEDRYATARDLLADLQADAVPDGQTGPRGAAPDDRPAVVLPAGERRQATIVHCRLSDHAALVDALARPELDALAAHIGECAREVAAGQGGTVDAAGDAGVVLLFGVPATHEDDCLRGVRAALELHRRAGGIDVAADGRAGVPIRLHIGIDTGAIVAQPVEDRDRAYRIAGTAPAVAARLADLAEPGEILMTPECRRLAGPFLRMAPGPSVAVRDRDGPIATWRVIGESGLTRLEAAGIANLTRFTGRDEQLGTLRACLARAVEGQGRLVTVLGEAGVGKSRLLYEFRQGLDAGGVRVLQGRCESQGSGTAYLPFIDTLRTALGADTTDDPVAHAANVVSRVRAIGSELEEFIPIYLHLLSISSDEFPVPTHMHGDTFRLAIQEALAGMFTLLARRRPTVLLLEDWHWVDDASHAVVRQLAELAPGYPLLIAISCRPGYIGDWGNPGSHTALPLRPLEEEGSISIVTSILGVDRLPDGLGARINERAGGNPFFLEELCHALREAGVVSVEHGAVVLSGLPEALHLPDTIQAVIRARIDHLDADVRETLRTASVVGREFTRSLLEHLLPDGERLRRAVDTLRAADLIQQTHVIPEPTYRFKHVLTQEAAYDSLLGHQLEELHGRVGTAIQTIHAGRMDEHADRLAHHFSRARQWQSAVRYAIRAADRSGALALFPEALATLEQAQNWLVNLPEGPQRHDSLVEILLRQERLCETLGLRGRQQRIIDELIRLLEPSGDRARLAEAYLRQGDLHTLLRAFDAAEAALQKSLSLRRELGDRVGERNTLRSLGLQRWHEGRDREALDAIEQALAIDRERGDVDAIVGDLSNLGSVLKGTGRLERARACLEEALGYAENLPASVLSPIKLPYILHILANVHRELGETDRALDYLERAKRHTFERRLPIQLSYHDTAIAHIHLQRGDIEASLAHYREAVDLTRRAGFVSGLAQSLRFLGELEFGLGRRVDALPSLEEAAGLFAQLGDGPTEAELWSRIAEVNEQEANHPEALSAWARVRTLRRRSGDTRGEIEALEGLARVTRRHVAEASLALDYYHEALALAQRLGDRHSEGRVRNAVAILEWGRGAWDVALAQYEAALHIFRELGDDANIGLMLNSIGVTLRALGRREEARERLEEALAHQRRSGHALLEGHALAALGDLWRDAGDADRALECFDGSLAIRRAIGDRSGEGWMLRSLADLYHARGPSDRARDLMAEAAHIAVECGDTELARACERL